MQELEYASRVIGVRIWLKIPAEIRLITGIVAAVCGRYQITVHDVGVNLVSRVKRVKVTARLGVTLGKDSSGRIPRQERRSVPDRWRHSFPRRRRHVSL